MKKILTLMCAAAFCSALFAQEGILDIHPAAPADGKVLSMQEAILGRNVYPESIYCSWRSDNEYAFYKNREWHTAALKPGLTITPEEHWEPVFKGNSLLIAKGGDTQSLSAMIRRSSMDRVSAAMNSASTEDIFPLRTNP